MRTYNPSLIFKCRDGFGIGFQKAAERLTSVYSGAVLLCCTFGEALVKNIIVTRKNTGFYISDIFLHRAGNVVSFE